MKSGKQKRDAYVFFIYKYVWADKLIYLGGKQPVIINKFVGKIEMRKFLNEENANRNQEFQIFIAFLII